MDQLLGYFGVDGYLFKTNAERIRLVLSLVTTSSSVLASHHPRCISLQIIAKI
jgi:hypothetical protein